MPNVMVIGNTPTAHAIAWKLSQSSEIERLYCAPGNVSTEDLSVDRVNVDLDPTTPIDIADYARKNKVNLVVPTGPRLLEEGIIDELRMRGVRAFGPEKEATQLIGEPESAYRFMNDHNIPTTEEQPTMDMYFLSDGRTVLPLTAVSRDNGVDVITPINKNVLVSMYHNIIYPLTDHMNDRETPLKGVFGLSLMIGEDDQAYVSNITLNPDHTCVQLGLVMLDSSLYPILDVCVGDNYKTGMHNVDMQMREGGAYCIEHIAEENTPVRRDGIGLGQGCYLFHTMQNGSADFLTAARGDKMSLVLSYQDRPADPRETAQQRLTELLE